jgi:VWFA-related protein
MWRRSLYLLLPLAISLNSQTAQTPASANPTFKAKAQLVLVDVVVTDSKGHPVTGLSKDDFEIFESADLVGRGDEQTIASFEEHKGAPPRIEPPHPLAPHFYTNAPSVASADSVNVLLLDALNTASEDQAAVRRQMIEYLKTFDPGPRLAIFTLGSRLRIVEGFSSDPRALIDALNHKNWGGMPHASTPVQTQQEADVNQKLQQQMIDTYASEASIQALQAFLSEENATEQVSRISVTLEGIRQLCQYLSGFPGRKNLIWFSGSFPTISFSGSFPTIHFSPGNGDQGTGRTGLESLLESRQDPGVERDLEDTVNLLAAAQVAVYPVAAQGLEGEPLFGANELTPLVGGGPPAKRVKEGTDLSLDQASTARVANTGAEDEIASDTGGQAFYNNNGLKDALAEAVQRGSYYYSLSYSPTDRKTLGRYRRIQVKLRDGHYTLAYRRGYFEEGRGQSQGQQQQTPDALQPLLRRGLPDATQIIFNLRVLRTTMRPAATPAIAGDNQKLHDQVTRFSADFVVPLENLDFDITGDGVRHGNLELALVAYDHDGNALNWLFRSITTSLKPDVYPVVLKTGAVFHEDIDVPNGENYLRAGIYDPRSNQAGSLEIPLSEVTAAVAVAASKTIQKPPAVAPSPAPLTSTAQAAQADNTSATPVATETNSALTATTAPEPTAHVPQAPPQLPPSQDLKEAEITDIPVYCAQLSQTVQHSSALASVCQFALSTVRRFPDLICNREMKRYWTEYRRSWVSSNGIPAYDDINRSDVLTAEVTYRGGQEYYDHLQLNGKPVRSDASALPPSSLLGPWSLGEFATALEGIFLPSSKAEFQFKKQTHIGSAKALLFTFHVAAANNRYYFLFAAVDNKWFPEYDGELWVDENGLRLLRLHDETAYSDKHPIRSVKTTIDYASIFLPDGSIVVLPIRSRVSTCAAPVQEGGEDNCSHSLLTFANWHKFKATAKMVTNPKHQGAGPGLLSASHH